MKSNDQDDFDNSDSNEDEDEDEDNEDDSESDEYGIDKEEMYLPGDDDDHREMGEIGSSDEDEEEGMTATFEGGMEAVFDSDPFPSEDHDESSEEEVAVHPSRKQKKSVKFNNDPVASTSTLPSTSASAPESTRYVPPHLRQPAASASTSSPFEEEEEEEAAEIPGQQFSEPPADPRLRRQINGLLNKLSSSNIPSIISALAEMYTTHPRALVSSTLTSLLLEIISGRDNLGEQFVITYAALVAALSRTIGIELSAGVIAKSIGMFDEALAKNHLAREEESNGGENRAKGGFEGRPGSKESENIVAFLAELYNFSVVACVLIYDLVKQFIDSGLDELEVELLVKVVKRWSLLFLTQLHLN